MPSVDSSLQDQRVSAAEPGEHRRVGIGEAFCDLSRLDEARIPGFCVSLEQERQGLQHPQPGLLDAVAAAVLQEPAAAADPAHRRSQVAPEEEPERVPERTACGALGFAAAQPGVVRGRSTPLRNRRLSRPCTPRPRGARGPRPPTRPSRCAADSSANASPHNRRSNEPRARSPRSATAIGSRYAQTCTKSRFPTIANRRLGLLLLQQIRRERRQQPAFRASWFSQPGFRSRP